jgi:ubiquinone/menaquinone biosynthesis C-methylase UbiE
LDAQVDLFWSAESALYERAGLGNAETLVDLGSGTGRLMSLLKQKFPALTIIGIEIDASLIEEAKLSNVTDRLDRSLYMNASVMDTKLPDTSCDVAVFRLVLEHLSDPQRALREAVRILKPGGRIIVIDNDFDFHLRTWPPISELDEYYSAYCSAREKEGGCPRIGRQLPFVLHEAGFSEVTVEILCAHNHVVGDALFLQSEGQGIPEQLMKSGFIEGKKLYIMKKKWAAMLRCPGHAIVRQLFCATGVTAVS